jgi:hypothetical protein
VLLVEYPEITLRIPLALLSLSLISVHNAAAQSFVAISEEAAIAALCDTTTRASQPSSELYYIPVSGVVFLPYNQTQGVLPLKGTDLSGLSGSLRFLDPPSQLETRISPDDAKRFLNLFKAGNIEARAAFRLDPTKSCVLDKLQERILYKVPAELLLLEFSRKTNGRPLLRFETESFQRWKLEETLQVVLTTPTLLSGEATLGKLSASLPDRKPLLQRCYAKAIPTNRKAQGTLTARVRLNQEGNPEDVEIMIDTLGDEAVHLCVVESLRQGNYAAANASFSFTMYLLQNP